MVLTSHSLPPPYSEQKAFFRDWLSITFVMPYPPARRVKHEPMQLMKQRHDDRLLRGVQSRPASSGCGLYVGNPERTWTQNLLLDTTIPHTQHSKPIAFRWDTVAGIPMSLIPPPSPISAPMRSPSATARLWLSGLFQIGRRTPSTRSSTAAMAHSLNHTSSGNSRFPHPCPFSRHDRQSTQQLQVHLVPLMRLSCFRPIRCACNPGCTLA